MAKTQRQWVALQLREDVWGKPIADLEETLRKVLGDATIWFPAVAELTGLHDPNSPYAPYVFVEPPVNPAVRRLWCVEALVPTPMDEKELVASVGRPAPLRPGDRVRVISGPYRLVEGVVAQVRAQTCSIRIALDSGDRTIHHVQRTAVELD